MRLLKINDYIVDVDNKTAIGIDVHGLDLTKPEDRYVNSSNSFTIPRTVNNLKAIGYVGGIPNSQPTIYDNFSVQYFLNNEVVIDGAYVIIQEISERIKLNIVRKPTLWDEMKSLEWQEFTKEYFEWLVSEKGLPDTGNRVAGTFLDSLNDYLSTSDSSLRLYPCYTNEADYLSIDFQTQRSKTFQILYNTNTPTFRGNGGHMWSDVKSLFEFIEYKYSVNFDISGTEPDNPFLNTVFLNTIWNIRNIAFVYYNNEYWFDFYNESFADYLMINELTENNGGSLYGLMYSILNIHGIIIENYDTNKYRLRDISYDIQNKPSANTVKLQLEDVRKSKIIPFIKGYGQESIVKYSDYADGITSVNTRKIVPCNNKNIQFRKKIIDIENFIPAFKDDLMNYGVDKSFDQYKIATWEEVSETYTWESYFLVNNTEILAKADYKKVIPIDLSDKWGILDEALQDPLYIEAKCWITPTQYSKINNWTLYYIPEFSGAYYINKVKGYNPEKSKQAVKLQLIRINNNTPK